jgi:hypothetical protein
MPKKNRKAPNHRIRSKTTKKPNHRISSPSELREAIVKKYVKDILSKQGIRTKDEAILSLSEANHRIRSHVETEYAKALLATHHASKMNQNDPGTSSIRNLYVSEWFNALSRLKKLLENSD